ncbi:MAG: hypothetical protein [Circular genetic element sp.]|nr:MAG: hypothetical protein [Circular genetic element sp.]
MSALTTRRAHGRPTSGSGKTRPALGGSRTSGWPERASDGEDRQDHHLRDGAAARPRRDRADHRQEGDAAAEHGQPARDVSVREPRNDGGRVLESDPQRGGRSANLSALL